MYGKTQESGFTEIIPLICTSAIWGQCPVFSHPDFPQGSPREWQQSDGSSVQFSHSVMSDSLRPHELQHSQASLSITNSWSLLKFMSIESVMPSSHLILCRTLFPLPPIPPSISPSNKYSGLRKALNSLTEIPVSRDWLILMAQTP